MEKNNNEIQFTENARVFTNQMKGLIDGSKPLIITIENESYFVTRFMNDRIIAKHIKDGNVFTDVSYEQLSTVIPDITELTIYDSANNEGKMYARLDDKEILFSWDELSKQEELIVTKALDVQSNSYGYCCYKEGVPYCYSQGGFINNLATPYDLEGFGLRYPGPKSKIYRKMSGPFWYYVNEYDFEYLNFCIKTSSEAELKVSQRMAGYNEQDAVSILMVDFTKKEVSIAGDVQVVEGQGKKNVRIGTVGLDFDYKKGFEMALEAELASKFVLTLREEEMLRQAYNQSVANSINLFADVFKELGISYPISIEGSVPTIEFEAFWKEIKKQPSVSKVLEANTRTSYISEQSVVSNDFLMADEDSNEPKRIG